MLMLASQAFRTYLNFIQHSFFPYYSKEHRYIELFLNSTPGGGSGMGGSGMGGYGRDGMGM